MEEFIVAKQFVPSFFKVNETFSSLIGILVFLPFFIIIAFLIKLNMPGPIIFFQKRVGQHGKLFRMIKFRTMTIDHGGSSISVKGESGYHMRVFINDQIQIGRNPFPGNEMGKTTESLSDFVKK